jgi:hypothetical protein
MKYGISISVGRDNDRRFKLTEDQILDMREWRNLGKSLSWLASYFKVSTTTVLYHTDSEFNKKTKEKNAKRRRSKEEEKDNNKNKQLRRKLVRPIVRAYTTEQMRQWRKDNREKSLKQGRESAKRWRAKKEKS